MAAPAGPRAAAAAILPLVESFSRADEARPAIAAIVATPDEIVLRFVTGRVSTASPREADPDTAFYVASQTKSYVSLLAARLDLEGILRLDASLADIWPGLALPPGVEAGRITMLHLLTHRVPLSHDELVERTMWREEVPAADYPRWLAASEAREPDYRYDNLGYLIYAAALETATGAGWKHWLERELLAPLGLSRSSARSSDFGPCEIAWRHKREADRWVALPPKPDALMHAAGGLFTSASDLATWMQANLRGSAAGLPAELFHRAHRPVVRAEARDGPFDWTHYALGQQCGAIAGLAVIGHRGGYEGARSITLFSPRAGVGLAIAVAADFETRELLDRIAAAFFGTLANHCRS